MQMPPQNHFYIAPFFVLLWVTITVIPSTVSTPWTPPAAFQSGAHWRLLVPRKSHRADADGRRRVCNNSSSSKITSCSRRSPISLPSSSSSNNNIIDRISRALGIHQSFQQTPPQTSTSISNKDPKNHQCRVIRTAARPHQPSGGSIPSSRQYTTRKPSLPMIAISTEGVTGDYNHYRTVALKSTKDRAISILTRDVSSYIQTLDGGTFASGMSTSGGGSGSGYRDGDLGENILVEGVDFGFFKIGQRYKFSSQKGEGKAEDSAITTTTAAAAIMEDVIVEITEPMEPCANLCKLPFINDPSLSITPRERVARCQYFIEALGQREGLRGWYAKVVQGGVVHVGDSLESLAIAA